MTPKYNVAYGVNTTVKAQLKPFMMTQDVVRDPMHN